MTDPIHLALAEATAAVQDAAGECGMPALFVEEARIIAAAGVTAFLRACPLVSDLPPGMDRMGFFDEWARERWASAVEQAARTTPARADNDAAAFLARMSHAAETGGRVTAEDVARLRRMADWADAAPAAGWNGTLDKGETARAIRDAKERMRDE